MQEEYKITSRTVDITTIIGEPRRPEGSGWTLHSTNTTSLSTSSIHILWTWKRQVTSIQDTGAVVSSPLAPYCCSACFKKSGRRLQAFMIACKTCGNKRCPKSLDHRFKCTGSNDPNQVGVLEEQEAIEPDE